jgi:hypothetical protein
MEVAVVDVALVNETKVVAIGVVAAEVTVAGAVVGETIEEVAKEAEVANAIVAVTTVVAVEVDVVIDALQVLHMPGQTAPNKSAISSSMSVHSFSSIQTSVSSKTPLQKKCAW